ncbi:MAG: 16S rRNA (adenine(1518)-N(6)/adenine(1519)-N(6))-dimethyltransferase, partial [Clostridia bacterium]|nr:16S rRNA (adenine(1518)-N(6)/adenine(1519)-N(6))-dimethyltransferase [Clostridia bacterium]
LRDVIKFAFEMRRKTLANALGDRLSGISKEQVIQAILQLGFDERIRGERLSTEDFVNLSNILYEIKNAEG